MALAALTCCFLWGSAVPAVRLGFSSMGIETSDAGSQLVFAGLRFTLSGLCILAFYFARHGGPRLLTRPELSRAAVLSVFQTFGQYLPYYIGLAHVTGVTASVIQGVKPIIAFLIAALFFRMEPVTGAKLLGCALGFVGVLVGNASSLAGMGFSMEGEGLMVLAAVSAAMSAALIGKLSRDEDPVVLAGGQFVIGGVALLAVGLLLGGSVSLGGPLQLATLAWLVMVSAVAYGLWGVLLSVNDVSRVEMFSFLIPVAGVLLSLLVLGDEGQPVGATTFVGLAIACAGITLVNRRAKAR